MRPATPSIRPIGCVVARTGARCSVRLRCPIAHAIAPGPASRQLRAASGRLVRAESSDRGFRRDLRRLADAALGLAAPLRLVAGAAQAALRAAAGAGEFGKHRPPVRCRTRIEPLHTQQRTLEAVLPQQAQRAQARAAATRSGWIEGCCGSSGVRPGARALRAAALLRAHKARLLAVTVRRNRRRALSGASDPAQPSIARSERPEPLRARSPARRLARRRARMLRRLVHRYRRSAGLRLRA